MAEKAPGVSVPHITQGRENDCLIGTQHEAIPITLKGDTRFSTTITTTVLGPAMYVRGTTSPYYARPMQLGGIVSAESSTVYTLTASGEAAHFIVGDIVGFWDDSADDWGLNSGTVSSVSESANTVTLTFAANPVPETGADIMCVRNDAGSDNVEGTISGTDQNVNACIVLQDVIYDGSADFMVQGYIGGKFVRSLINRRTTFDRHENQAIQLIDIVREG